MLSLSECGWTVVVLAVVVVRVGGTGFADDSWIDSLRAVEKAGA